MKNLLIIVFIALVVISCNSKKSNELDYTISMNLVGFEDSTLFKILDLDKLEFIDSTYLNNGKLKFKGKVKEPFSARIHTIDDKYLILWIENVEIKIEGNYKDFEFSNIEGSSLNTVMTKYRDKQKILQISRDSLMQQMIRLMSSQSANAEEDFQKLNSQVSRIDKEVFAIRSLGIVSEQPSHYTIKELYFLRNDFTKDSLELLFAKFTEPLQSTQYGEVIRTYIENKSIAVGDRYIDIKGINMEGQTIKLSEFDGKYVLLDFWASWCGPCRQENPNLVKTYRKFKNKGFEIFSFSTDSNIASWKKAIEKDSLIWTNVIDENGSYSKMSALYGVRAIPSSFLINPKGVVIAMNLRGKALEDQLNEQLNNPPYKNE
jgi:peroxiredoxin